MSVRPAQAGDAAAVTDLWNAVIRDTLITFNTVEKSFPEIAALIGGGAAGVFVAEAGGAVVGFATYGQFRAGAGYARTMEHSVHLDEAARGRGLGRRLVAAVEADAAARGAHTLIAGVSSANPGSVAFHAALGFAHVATLPEVGYKWGRWLDLHLMQKRLSPGRASG